jgi:hypothetical protein
VTRDGERDINNLMGKEEIGCLSHVGSRTWPLLRRLDVDILSFAACMFASRNLARPRLLPLWLPWL